MIVSRGRDADASGLGDALKARRNIDAVPEDIMGLYNHVTDIDADTEGNSPVCDIVNCKFPDTGLKLQSSSNRLDRARKVRQEPVSGALHDSAAVLGDYRGDSVD